MSGTQQPLATHPRTCFQKLSHGIGQRQGPAKPPWAQTSSRAGPWTWISIPWVTIPISDTPSLEFTPLSPSSRYCREASALMTLHSCVTHGIGWTSWSSPWRECGGMGAGDLGGDPVEKGWELGGWSPGPAPDAFSSCILQLHHRVRGPGEHICSQDLPRPPCLENHHSDTRWDLKNGSSHHAFSFLEVRVFNVQSS